MPTFFFSILDFIVFIYENISLLGTYSIRLKAYCRNCPFFGVMCYSLLWCPVIMITIFSEPLLWVKLSLDTKLLAVYNICIAFLFTQGIKERNKNYNYRSEKMQYSTEVIYEVEIKNIEGLAFPNSGTWLNILM